MFFETGLSCDSPVFHDLNIIQTEGYENRPLIGKIESGVMNLKQTVEDAD